MNKMRGRRKRKENEDRKATGVAEKRIKTCAVNGNNDNSKIETITLESTETNKVQDEGKLIINREIKTNGIIDTDNDSTNSSKNESSDKKDIPFPSFHSKFSKSKPENEESKGSSTAKSCFACKAKDDNLVQCSVDSCDKFYHSKCLENLPNSKMELNACPLHFCVTCYNINPKNPQISKGQMYKCFKCPTAFHAKEECNIPGSVILTHDIMSCPDHFSPEKQREYPPVVNLLFCIHCGCSEELIFCKFCPLAVHKECCRGGTFMDDNSYMCDRCESRKIVFFEDIVWAKIYNFRWWPAKVLNPRDIPVEVLKLKHFEGEFPVQLFGTLEYYWTQKGRVYPFVLKTVGVEDDGIKHNFKKQMQDVVFDNAVCLARKAIQELKTVKLADATNNKKPPPYKHIKNNRPIGSVQIYTFNDSTEYTHCGCKASHPDPCGYGSLCLNRSMCSECLPDVCQAGNHCRNQKFQKHEYANVKPFYTTDRGWGLKALEDIKKGHFVIEYVGDLIDEEECERRIEEKQVIGDTNFYFCTLDSNRIIDAGPKGNYSRFLNHSCEPNCETQKWIVSGDARVGIFAKKDIPAGSELTFDYQMDFAHYKKLKCNCGSERCSGLIGKKPQNGVLSASVLLKSKELNHLNKPKNKKFESPNGLKEKSLCFKCKKGGKLIHCSQNMCNKEFHLRCLGNHPGPKTPEAKDWKCALHFCRKCKSSSEYQCFICPNAYCKKHVTDAVLKNKIFACPKHIKQV